MPLTPGTKLGPYEISAAIGAGGMGEVYRARDPRLNRDVAIKVLPASFSSDRERLGRFEQEALAAASLNHPNILAVYDIGTQESSPYIVSELLQGETLRERLRGGPIPVRKATEYAVQIAQGLAAAHDKGIVHRDLKPENIFITSEGRVKLLDFGLAKLTQPSTTPDTETRTIHSDINVLVGTVGYISPEQVRGKPADSRSDLFAFGAVLYEMLSGKRAFQGETSTDTMSAILHSDPPELTETNRSVPPVLERIVRHCLEKNPAERFHSAHDIAFDLQNLSSVSSGVVTAKAAAGWNRQWLLAAAIGLLLLVSVGAFFIGRFSGTPTQPVRFTRISFERGFVVMARFAPDGHSVIYDAAWEGNRSHLYSTPATLPEPRALDFENANLFDISLTGEIALGLRGHLSNHATVLSATLARSPLSGGAPREMLDNVMAADWGPDGNLAVAQFADGRTSLQYPIGKVLYESSGWISDLRFSPQGDKIAFLDHGYWPDDRGSVAVVDLSGKKTTISREWESEEGLVWSPDGTEIWFTAASSGVERSLYAITLAGKMRLMLSVPATLRLFDIYPDGRVLLGAGHERILMMGVTPDGKSHDLSWSGWTIAADVSPDGKQVLIDEQSQFAGAQYTVAIRSVEGSPPIKLGDGELSKFSPDGKWVATAVPGQPNHFLLLPTGAGQPKDIPVTGLSLLQRIVFMPDGRLLLIGHEPDHGVRCYLRTLEDASMRAVSKEGSFECRSSPDSQHIVAFQSGGLGLYNLNQEGGTTIPNTVDMVPIRWTDNRTVLAFRRGEMPGIVYEIDTITAKQKVFKELVPGDRAGVSQLTAVVSSPDGKTLAYSYQQVLSDLYVVEGLK
jgi:eukaryotic-like serine/threonine-protein kinase